MEMSNTEELSEAVIGTTMHDESNEEAFVIFADGSDANMPQFSSDQTDENQHLSIGDDGITIVVTPENEHQVSELLRALQASQNDGVHILTDDNNELHDFVKIKEEGSAYESDTVEPAPKKRKGRPSKPKPVANASEIMDKKTKLIELALQEADASVPEAMSTLKSSRLREKAAKHGGLKKLWLTDDSVEENVNVETDELSLRSDGEGETIKCDDCPEVYHQSC